MFVDRRRRAGRFLEWKVGLFSVAAVLTLAGMYLAARWMTGLAIVVLASALLLRFLPGGSVAEEDWDDDDDEGGDLDPQDGDRELQIDSEDQGDPGLQGDLDHQGDVDRASPTRAWSRQSEPL